MWYQAVLDLFRDAVNVVWARSPALIVAATLLLIGWAVGLVLSRIVRYVTGRLISRWQVHNPDLSLAMKTSGALAAAPRVVGSFGFWLTLLLFGASAAEIAGLPIMTDVLGRTTTYLPNILVAAIIVLLGLVGGRLAQGATTMAAQAAGVPQGRAVARVVHGVILVATLVIALEQLGVNSHVLELTLVVTLGSVLAAAALAFGLGARSSVANLIASRYVAQFCEIGQMIQLEEIEGTVVGLTPTAVVLETEKGRIFVPAERFQKTHTLLVSSDG
jgi:small-conductance mechanosensitive channel